MTTSTASPPRPTDLVVGLYAAVAEGDLPTAAALLHPDVVLHVPGTHPLAGDHHGPAGVAAFVQATSEAADRTERVAVLDVLAGGRTDHVAALCRSTGEREGRVALDNPTIHLYRIDDGRIVEIWFHNWDQPAVDAFWS